MTSPIAAWLSERHMTQRQLAAEMGQAPSSISMKINGDTSWQQKDLVFFSQRYGLSSDFVLGLVPREGLLV